jgi:hypothetical protein
MNLLERCFATVRTWLGLADQSDDHPTPSHGWLLPRPETLLKLRARARARTREASAPLTPVPRSLRHRSRPGSLTGPSGMLSP